MAERVRKRRVQYPAALLRKAPQALGAGLCPAVLIPFIFLVQSEVIMIDILISILIFALFLFIVIMFTRIDNKKETAETKKCMRCLRRVKIVRHKCPYCGNTEYHY
jgi:hypothetical protein